MQNETLNYSYETFFYRSVFLNCLARFTLRALQEPGAPNDGFLLNALKSNIRLFRVLFISLEMHSKWRYKICIGHPRGT